MKQSDLTKQVKDFLTPVHTTLSKEQTIEEALNSLRGRRISEKVIYFYVVDDTGVLHGVVPTRKLLLKDLHTKIKEIMISSVIQVKEEVTLEEVLDVLSKHQLLAVPVVDERGRLKGVVDVQLYFEETVEIADACHTSDVFQILGLTLEEGKRKSPWKSYRIRMPWILCNMGGGIACAIISNIYREVLGQVLLLAMFIPLILTLSESIAMQSMTQSLHLVKQSDLGWRKLLKRILFEGRMVMLLALTCAIMVGILSLFWAGGMDVSWTIGTALLFTIVISASMGAAIPLLLYAKSLDPKVASGPVVLMFTDVIATTLYLSLATWWLL